MLQWHDPVTGKRKSKSAETCNPLDAETKRADLEYELNNNLHKETSALSWEKFREVFFEEYVAGTRKDTRRNYEATLDLFERLCKPTRLRSITERTISLFVAGLRKEPGRKDPEAGMQASTIKVRLQFLHTALAWAAGQKMLAEVPKFPTVKVPDKNPQPIPTEAFERLVAAAWDRQLRAYLFCGWLAGLRLAEALELEREPTDKAPYLDLPRNRICLPAEFTKAGKDQWIPLDPVLREMLEALPRHGKKVFRFEDRLGKVLGAGAVSQRVRYLAKRAGVRLTMKSLRQGFGCRHAGKVPAQVLQRLMRHANIKTTMDYYANIDAAVEEAILGTAARNSTRNSEAETTRNEPGGDVVNPSQDETNSLSAS
jgi:integrase